MWIVFYKKIKCIVVIKYKCLFSFRMENKRKLELCFVKVIEVLNFVRVGYFNNFSFKE